MISLGQVRTVTITEEVSRELTAITNPELLLESLRRRATSQLAHFLMAEKAMEQRKFLSQDTIKFSYYLTVVNPKVGGYSFADQLREAKAEGELAGLKHALALMKGCSDISTANYMVKREISYG